MSVICTAVPASRLVAFPRGVWSVSSSVMTNQIMLEISRSSIDLPCCSSSSQAMAPRHAPGAGAPPPLLQLVGRVLDADPAGQVVLRHPVGCTLRVLQPAEEDGRIRLLHGLHSEPAPVEVGELAVVLEQVVRPDALHDLDRFSHVRVPLREDV